VAVEDACATALDIGVHQYRFVRRYLERRPHPQMFLRRSDSAEIVFKTCGLTPERAAALRAELDRNKVVSVETSIDGAVAEKFRYRKTVA
jgi:hypothetical protein